MTNESKPNPVRTKEEARERGRNGCIASGKVRREKKAMCERLEILLDMSIKSDKGVNIDDIKNFAALNGKNITT